MGRNIQRLCLSLTLLLANWAFCEEASLQGALNAINRRQLGLSSYPKYEKFYSESGASRYSPPDNDLVFLGPAADSRALLGAGKEKSPLEYLEDIDLSNKQISSAFRERTAAENKLREKQKLNEVLLSEAKNNEDEYSELLREYYKKYAQYEPQHDPLNYYNSGEAYERNELRKRNHYNRHYASTSTTGLNMVGMKKRNGRGGYLPPLTNNAQSSDDLYLLVPNSPRNQMYPNSMAKRFPVTKRSSSNYYPIPFTEGEMPKQFKRSSSSADPSDLQEKFLSDRTDPKVALDLSSIFDKSPNRKETKRNDENTADKMVSKPKKTEHATETATLKSIGDAKIAVSTTASQVSRVKENFSPDNGVKSDDKEKPIQIKKKSIDWSDYFGLDKRKKADGLDNEWLMERYHKAVALTSKRNSESVDGETSGAESTNKTKTLYSTVSDDKINDMDAKLRNIEYAIVDDALKVTRSHSDGEFDPREVQEMKDRVISQLAAAYSLEKMRRALKEYRDSVRKERLALIKNENTAKSEEKRLSVPRKSAGDMETATPSDNNIKCSTSDENCYEQNYRTPDDLLDSTNFGYCPKIQRACAEIASIIGQYEGIVEMACTMHQMCLFCGDNTWFSPIRQCNVLFLNKADYLCNDDPECREVARHATRYLLELNKLLRSEPQLLDMCDLAC